MRSIKIKGFKPLTEKEKKEMKRKRIEAKSKLSLAFQLGVYVGEQIINKFLPTLSVDSIQTKTNISVTCEEGDECRRLNDVWFNKVMSIKGSDAEKAEATKEEWEALRDYHKMLEDKYLPAILECHLPLLNVGERDMDEFKKGIGVALWECDCSHYSCELENINVKEDDNGYFTIITLKTE